MVTMMILSVGNLNLTFEPKTLDDDDEDDDEDQDDFDVEEDVDTVN